jgi:glycerol-1-phosphate dehydrogenase [NAD(P)+]
LLPFATFDLFLKIISSFMWHFKPLIGLNRHYLSALSETEMIILSLLDRSWTCSCGKHTIPSVEIIVDNKALQKIPDLRNKLDLGKSCAIVDDVNTRKVAGLTVMDLLRSNHCSASEVIVDNPDETNVSKVVAATQDKDFLIGVGGTSVLDVTKLAAYRKGSKYILFSTGIANNGMSSKTCSIIVGGKKETIPVNLADAVIVDMTIISDAPSWMIPAGCGDLAAEVAAIKDWQLGRDDKNEPYCDSVADWEISALDSVMNNKEQIRSRTEKGTEALVWALIKSGLGMSIWGSSRPASGSEHLWSHWLDHYAEEHNTRLGQHGEQVGIGTLLMAKYHQLYNPNWWNAEEHPNYQAEAIMSFLRDIGAYANPAEIGVSRELSIEAFLGAWQYRKDRYTILHRRHPNLSDAEKVTSELGM